MNVREAPLPMKGDSVGSHQNLLSSFTDVMLTKILWV